VGLLLVLAGLGTVGALTAHWVGMAAGSVFALAVVLSLLGRGWPRPKGRKASTLTWGAICWLSPPVAYCPTRT